jgi:hypothetical protein
MYGGLILKHKGEKKIVREDNMSFKGMCQELNKFVQGEVSLPTIKDDLYLYWNSVDENGDNAENIAKAEILHIAVEAYESESFSKMALIRIIHQYSSGEIYQPQELNEYYTKSYV